MVRGPQPEPEVKEKTLSAILMPPPQRVTTLIKDHKLEYPRICWEVYIPDVDVRPEFAEMFVRAGCQWAKSLEASDLVVFTGGADVDPKIYGQKRHKETRSDKGRDERDIKLYAEALKMGIPMFGVCRGAQFLWAMNGGSLYQHIGKAHIGKHPIRDLITHETIQNVSSTHHQMCVDDVKKATILAVAWESAEKWKNDKECDIHHGQDIEAFWIADNCCLGVQGHPEFASYSKYTQWCLQQLDHYIANNPRVKVNESQHYRHQRLVEIVGE